MVIKIFLWLLALLGLTLLAVLFTPVRLYAGYRDGELSVWLKLLWFYRLDLYPIPEKKEKPPRKRKEKKAKEEPEEAPPQVTKGPVERFLDLLGTINDLLPLAGRTMGYILRRLTLRYCRVTMVVGEEDAADTAIKVGRIYAIGYNLYAVLRSLIRVKEFKFHITPDYTGPVQRAAADILLSVRPSALLMGGLIFLVKWLGMLIRNNLQRQPVKKSRKPRQTPAAT